MKSEFQRNIEAFSRIFQNEKRAIAPLASINHQAMEEICEEGSKLMIGAVFLTRMNYLTQSQRSFDNEDYLFCLKNFTSLSISNSLRLFQKPNHKDRFNFIISYLSKNTEIFSQIVYFFLSENHPDISDDDKSFFCFSTIPAIFLYFITKESQEAALSFFNNLFQFHFSYYPQLNMETEKNLPNFLNDAVFSYFLATNPGNFFENSINPDLFSTISFIEDRIHYYTKSLSRIPYWNQIIAFLKKVLNRMISTIYLLPISARKLITLLIQLTDEYNNTEMKYKLIVDNIICRYITTYVRSPYDFLMQDVATVIKTSCSMKTYIGKEATNLIINSKLPIDQLLNAMKTDKETPSDFSHALGLIRSITFITPRDLTLLYSSITYYIQFCEKPSTPQKISQNKEIVQKKLTSAAPPITDSDKKFLPLRTSFSDQTVSNVKMVPTTPFDEIVDLMNSIDLSNLRYSTPDELVNILFKFSPCPIDTNLKTQITAEVFTKTGEALEDIKRNKECLSGFLHMLSSSLFVLQNEREEFSMQCKIHRGIIMRSFVVPYIYCKNPGDFQFKADDLFQPSTLYGKTIENVDKRILPLQLSEENTFELKKFFILDFIDQIDISFDFQLKVAKDKISEIYSVLCQEHSSNVMELSHQMSTILRNASLELQYVKNDKRISYNLSIVLNAVRLLSVFKNKVAAVAMAQSISGNPEIFGFLYFVNSYFKDEITRIILNDDEKVLLAIFKEAGRSLRIGLLKSFSLC